jgi:hypothetical protein
MLLYGLLRRYRNLLVAIREYEIEAVDSFMSPYVSDTVKSPAQSRMETGELDQASSR